MIFSLEKTLKLVPEQKYKVKEGLSPLRPRRAPHSLRGQLANLYTLTQLLHFWGRAL